MTNPPDRSTTVQLIYFGLIRNVVKVPEETVALPVGATVRDLLGLLGQKHGESFSDALFTADGTLLANAIVLLDGRNILSAKGLETEIERQCSAHVLLTTTAMGGG